MITSKPLVLKQRLKKSHSIAEKRRLWRELPKTGLDDSALNSETMKVVLLSKFNQDSGKKDLQEVNDLVNFLMQEEQKEILDEPTTAVANFEQAS